MDNGNVANVAIVGLMMDFAFDDSDEYDGDEPVIWEKVSIVREEYRLLGSSTFKLHFRMFPDTFEVLVNAVGHILNDDEGFHRDPEYDLGLVMLMVVWVLATPDTFRSVALRFGVSPGVLHFHYLRIIRALCDMSEIIIKWPDAEERRVVSQAVEARTGFPGVVGAVDGSFIEIQKPQDQPERYVNRHHQSSIVLQGTCDETLLFRDVYIGEPGSMHDSRIFRRSPLCRRLLEDNGRFLSANEHILGDGAYMLTDKVLTPFRNFGNLGAERTNYNHRHASARVVIEQAFGRLKCMWRRLRYLSSHNIEYAVRTIMACCVLHNFVLLHGEVDFDEIPDVPLAREAEIDIGIDDGDDPVREHPNVRMERDHPLLAQARVLGREKRLDIVGRLPH